MNDDTIANTLGLTPLVLQTPVSNVPTIQSKSGGDEYEDAKQNMESIVEVGSAALSELAVLAQQSADPRVYRVLTELISAMVTANKEIIEMKKTNSEIDGSNAPQKVQNNMFVGSTAELAAMLEKMKNG